MNSELSPEAPGRNTEILKQSDDRFKRRITISPENNKDMEGENGLARFGALSQSDIAVGGQNFDAHPPESSDDESESSGSNNSLRTSQMVVQASSSVPSLSDILKFKVQKFMDIAKLYELLVARGLK